MTRYIVVESTFRNKGGAREPIYLVHDTHTMSNVFASLGRGKATIVAASLSAQSKPRLVKGGSD